MKTFWQILRPNYINISLLVVLMLISSFVSTGFQWTSKVNWHADRGFPFSFMTINEFIRGGYCPHNTICLATNIQQFYLYAFLLDVLVWYIVSCAIVFGYEILKKQHK